MAYTVVSPWIVGQRLKAATLNKLVTAIQELQADATTNYLCETAKSTTQAITAGTFTNVTSTVVTDTQSCWNAGGNYYTVPLTGTYVIASKVRPVDLTSTAIGIGQGVHTSLIDGPWFSWGAVPGTTSGRTSVGNTRIAPFNTGDQLKLYTYGDTAFTVQSASLVIYRLGT